MTATAVILAGGKGTRSADPTKAKLGQVVGGRSLMEWHLELLKQSEINEVLVVAGHLGDQVQALVDTIDHHGITVRVIHEAEQNGTVAALGLAASQSESNEYLVILGDILMSLPVQQFLDEWRASHRNVAVVVHPSTHPEDSDAVFPAHDGTVLVVPKSQPRDHIPNMSSAGLFAISEAGLRTYADLKDFGSNVLGAAAKEHDLFAFVSSHYLKDTGTPQRLEATKNDFASGAFERRGNLQSRPALFLDRDGVINPVKPEAHRPELFTLNSGVTEAIAAANKAGLPVLVVTNQPAIAKGFMTFETHEAVRAEMDRLLAERGAFVDDYAFCPHHPEDGHEGEVVELKVHCACRKPEPGMILTLARHHGIDTSRSTMVGDTDRDAGAAEAAGVRFFDTRDYPDVGPSEVIRRAIEVTTC